MTPMIEAAEREELARLVLMVDEPNREYAPISMEERERIATLLRQSAAAPVVTDAMVERMAHRFAEVFFRNAEPDTLVDLVAVETAMRSAVAFQAALSVQAPGVTADEIRQFVVGAMQMRWDDWVIDTGHCPPDIEFHGNKKIAFHANRWAENVADQVAHKVTAALTQSGRVVAEGCKLVPVVPTEEMIAVGWQAVDSDRISEVDCEKILRAAIAAAPEPR